MQKKTGIVEKYNVNQRNQFMFIFDYAFVIPFFPSPSYAFVGDYCDYTVKGSVTLIEKLVVSGIALCYHEPKLQQGFF